MTITGWRLPLLRKPETSRVPAVLLVEAERRRGRADLRDRGGVRQVVEQGVVDRAADALTLTARLDGELRERERVA